MNFLKSLAKFFTHSAWCYIIFWSWNLLFAVLLVYLEVEVGFITNISIDAFAGHTPWDFTLFSLLAIAIPLSSWILGFTKFLKEPKKLIRLFYGIEVPLTLFCLLRLWLLRELTPATTQILFLFVVGILFFFLHLIKGDFITSKIKSSVQLVGHSLILLIGSLLSVIFLFYVIPATWVLIKGFFGFEWLEIFKAGFWIFLWLIFFMLSATLFVGLPFALLKLYYTAFWQNFISYKTQYGIKNARIIVLGTLGINIVVYVFLNWSQSQEQVFSLLEKTNKSKEEIQELIDNKEFIRCGLVNAHLCRYRYISSVKSNNHVEEIYHDVFDLPKDVTKYIQQAYNLFTKPFLYDGDYENDPWKAEKLYESFFDEPIQKAERENIKHAMEATWERDGVEAGLLNIDEEKVLVTHQDIKTREIGDFAEIEIHERYLNKTFSNQEILYYFSLPENSVITGLWLSDNDSVYKKYKYNVSARGAAQKVYKEEVQRRVDPSLLEQVGPNQYRLRAFPVAAKDRDYEYNNDRSWRRNYTYIDGAPLHIWLSYKTASRNNAWPLPVLNEKRNAFFNSSTLLTINNKEVEKDDSRDWLPKEIETTHPPKAQIHYAQINDSTIIQAMPYKLAVPIAKKYCVAVVIDRSFSMNNQKEELEENIYFLKNSSSIDQTQSDVFLTGHSPELLSWNHFFQKTEKEGLPIFWGKFDQLSMLQQYDSLKRKNYDAVLFLTDKGSYENSNDSLQSIKSSIPVFMVHINGHFSGAYSDALNESIKRSGGKAVTSIDEALQYLSLKTFLSSQPNCINYEGGYLYSRANASQKTDAFDDIVAAHYINYLDRKHQSDNLDILDKTNLVAKKFGIVSAYSSMIVLVNEEQLKALIEAENKADRFKREAESGHESTPMPHNAFQVSGTPEPEEWALIALSALVLAVFYRKNLLLLKS